MSDGSQKSASEQTRRDFNRLMLAAVGGLIAGLGDLEQLHADDKRKGSSSQNKKASAPKKEVHVCRGLNSCKAQGIDWDFDGDGKLDTNACAGQGACATAKHVSCNGENDCKGQGGCGNTAGENACKGQGKCHVPLTTDTWKKARARYEARMRKENKSFGEAPVLVKKVQGKRKQS